MAMTTSLRFELDDPNATALRQALGRQTQRIKNDEIMEQRDRTVKEDLKSTLVAHWRDTMDESAARRRLRREREEVSEELALTNKELLAVRRAQMKRLLAEDRQKYEREFDARGLTFYQQRI